MAISRAQQARQQYGLGSLVKSITKPIKKLVKSDAGKLGILALGAFGLPGGFGGMTGFLPEVAKGAVGDFFTKNALGKVLRDVGIGTAVGGGLEYLENRNLPDPIKYTSGRTDEDIEEIERELRSNYEDLGYSNDEIEERIKIDMKPYRTAAATGGRIGLAKGTDEKVEMAAGIESLPINVNSKGVKELDLRETGGFIPPVGVKEKADDIPAMLSNNEFVFTADAVRAAGGGSVDKGAQLMYDTMKQLESRIA